VYWSENRGSLVVRVHHRWYQLATLEGVQLVSECTSRSRLPRFMFSALNTMCCLSLLLLLLCHACIFMYPANISMSFT
jgi:hypothetical protein